MSVLSHRKKVKPMATPNIITKTFSLINTNPHFNFSSKKEVLLLLFEPIKIYTFHFLKGERNDKS